MNRMFICDSDFTHEFERKEAKGYKKVKIEDDVQSTTFVDIVSDGDTLVIKKAENQSPDNEYDIVYTLLTKEVGLFEGAPLPATASVIQLGQGYMLFTLHIGAVLASINDCIYMLNVGLAEYPEYSNNNEVYWLQANTLIDFGRYMENKSLFLYDFEFMYNLSGNVKRGLSNFKYKHIDEDDIDISLGAYAAFLQTHKNDKCEDENKTALGYDDYDDYGDYDNEVYYE